MAPICSRDASVSLGVMLGVISPSSCCPCPPERQRCLLLPFALAKLLDEGHVRLLELRLVLHGPDGSEIGNTDLGTLQPRCSIKPFLLPLGMGQQPLDRQFDGPLGYGWHHAIGAAPGDGINGCCCA